MARPRKHPLPTIAELRRHFVYNPITGSITIRAREGDDPYIRAFNRRYAGNVVGSVMNVGYRWIKVPGHGSYLGHRIAWALHYGEWPGELDHRDGNKLNNAIDNLRPATRAQNAHNRRVPNQTGFKGVKVGYVTVAGVPRWYAQLSTPNGGTRHLGVYDTPELAAEAYAKEARKVHGEFALTPVGGIAAMISFAKAA